MSADFIRTHFARGRKCHRCDQCRGEILPGTDHRYTTMKFEGSFSAYREHFECHEAWDKLNFSLRKACYDEGAPFLRDDDEHDAGDKEWMRREYPLVAERLGWSGTSA